MGFFDFLNPPAANVPTPQINSYQPSGFSSADSGALGGIGNLGGFNTYANLFPQATNIAQGTINNPYAQSYQTGAGTASTLGQDAATNAFGAGGGLYNLAGNIANTAFDPQSALYNRTLQQTQDQIRAGNAASGVATTPYGAGIEAQGINNFNIDWQNNQLNRQISGGNAAGGLTTQGAGLQAGASPAYYGASGLPYTTFAGMGAGNLSTLGNLAGFGASGAQIPQQQITDYLNYLGWGTGQQNAGNQANLGLGTFNLNQANSAFNQQQTIFGDIGKVAGTAAAMFI